MDALKRELQIKNYPMSRNYGLAEKHVKDERKI
jgi:hypothetical protein